MDSPASMGLLLTLQECCAVEGLFPSPGSPSLSVRVEFAKVQNASKPSFACMSRVNLRPLDMHAAVLEPYVVIPSSFLDRTLAHKVVMHI